MLTSFTQADLQDVQQVLASMAQVKICCDEGELTITVPDFNHWGPTDSYAKDFAALPTEFARSYLRLRLRNFLYETFCWVNKEQSHPTANDRLGGGLQVELLQQFDSSNKGQGYFDPGWRVLQRTADGDLAVEKYGVTIYVNPVRHLAPAQRAPEKNEQVAVLLPGYRYEPGCYVAIGNLGPVDAARERTIEVYFAATVAAMSPIMTTITTALSEVVPYTLRVPYRPEGFGDADAVALRVRCADYEQVLPVVQQIAQACRPWLCDLRPVFARSLFFGISTADVIESSATQWHSSSADLSRTQLVADALEHLWYEMGGINAADKPTLAQNLAAIKARFAQEGLSLRQPACMSLSVKEPR